MGHPTYWTFHCIASATNLLHDPLQHTHVIAKARPLEVSVLVFAKPVNSKNSWRIWNITSKLQPVIKIVAHVITAERQHGEWIASHFTQLTKSGSSHL